MNNKVTADFINQLQSIVGERYVITHPTRLDRNSRDTYWYSPVLKKQLDGKVADAIVQPASADELTQIISACVQQNVPIVPRGAGTGNYGQSVPIYGGISISTKRMNSILDLTREVARLEAGVILLDVETAARKIGAELRFFPSTLPTSTAAGFLAGGSAGPGSMNWGNLWTSGNILQTTIITIEEQPQTIVITDPGEMQAVIHNCGLTAFISEVSFALAPAEPWKQYVIAIKSFEDGLRLGEQLAHDKTFPTRLVSVIDWPAPRFFKQLVRQDACPEGHSLVLLHTTQEAKIVEQTAQTAGAAVTWHNPVTSTHKSNLELTDFAWNHTTLWAIKADPQWTYLQDTLEPTRFYEQLHKRKARFGDDIIDHVEFTGAGNEPYPAGLTLVRYHSDEQLQDVIDFGESIGIMQYSPHTTLLDEENTRWEWKHLIEAKRKWDPNGLLNPGHLIHH